MLVQAAVQLGRELVSADRPARAIAGIGVTQHTATMKRWRDTLRGVFSGSGRTDRIEQHTLDQLDLERIERVTFLKREEVTTDLICCEVQIGGQVWFFHEEAEGWDALLCRLEKLPGFFLDWRSKVVQPPFAPSETVAYTKE